MVPEDCRFTYEFRNLPGVDVEPMQREVVGFAESLEPAIILAEDLKGVTMTINTLVFFDEAYLAS